MAAREDDPAARFAAGDQQGIPAERVEPDKSSYLVTGAWHVDSRLLWSQAPGA